MKKLSKKDFQKACSFVESYARPIDRSFLSFWKEEASAEEVLHELEAFRNSDGGFGHSLEPDFRLKESSPMATTVAFQYMNKIGVSKNHPFVKDGIEYFMNTLNTKKERWIAVSDNVNDVPHAPWWHVSGNENRYSANPDAEIVGYLLYYGDDNNDLANGMLSKVLDHLEKLNEYEIHEVLCYLRLARLVGGEEEECIIKKIHNKLPLIIDPPEKWDHYGVQPVVLAESDQSPFAEELNQELHVNLDYIVDKQLADGSFEPNWEWGQYEDEWKKAKGEWKGYLTVQQLIVLSQFGRIES
ncbi:hypothetical protein [Pseudalkalibacillus hwajinpoensis]|uniref:Uncharacterized protein n=1 Tax=Guptibacillus hwajinpoensis TaxID=208199 RepID=A0A4U1MJM7_9BACL|nr:hypothetical protein [Pseudalkalibacillus hwajinpoensis]TKD71303.1 hypothetical protein FBF83_00375 [Pseudalkalibacillus hwajinpoensis]